MNYELKRRFPEMSATAHLAVKTICCAVLLLSRVGFRSDLALTALGLGIVQS